MSLFLSIAVITAVVALIVAAVSMLMHPHVCSLMQGDWTPELDDAQPPAR